MQRMYLSGRDVTEAIRENAVSALASKVAALPAVREFLLDFQRRQARERDVVMDGRDIGTVVLPRAGVKIFLTAAPGSPGRSAACWSCASGGRRRSLMRCCPTSSAGMNRTGPGLSPPSARQRTLCCWTRPSWTGRAAWRLCWPL